MLAATVCQCLSGYVVTQQRVSTGALTVMGKTTVCGYYSFIVQKTLPIFCSSAEVKLDAVRSVVAYGSFQDNGYI